MAEVGKILGWADDDEAVVLPGESEAQKIDACLEVRNPCPRVEQLILGGGSIGCLLKDLPPEEAHACVERAIEVGIRYIDTAPWYGAGLSETRIGESLTGRDDVLISTKCGRLVVPKADLNPKVHQIEAAYEHHFYTDKYHMNRVVSNYTGAGIRESVNDSCKRLKIDTIHCLRLHDVENLERFTKATAPGGAVDCMIALKAEGKVIEISLGMNSVRYIIALLRMYPCKFDNIMLSNSFNLIDHDCHDLLLLCQSQGVHIHNAGIFASGLLWGGDHYMYSASIPDHVREKVTKWNELAEKHGVKLPQIALNFALFPSIINRCAFGARCASEVDQNIELCGKMIPRALWVEARRVGLIASWIPLPEAADSEIRDAKRSKFE